VSQAVAAIRTNARRRVSRGNHRAEKSSRGGESIESVRAGRLHAEVATKIGRTREPRQTACRWRPGSPSSAIAIVAVLGCWRTGCPGRHAYAGRRFNHRKVRCHIEQALKFDGPMTPGGDDRLAPHSTPPTQLRQRYPAQANVAAGFYWTAPIAPDQVHRREATFTSNGPRR